MKQRIIIEYGLNDDESQGEQYGAVHYSNITLEEARALQQFLNASVEPKDRSYVPS